MIEAGAPSTGDCWHAFRGVPVPPGVGMVSPPTTQRNASSAQCEGRARYDGENQRGSGHYRDRSPNAPARTGVLEEPQYEQHHHDYYHNDYHRADHPSPPPRTGSPARHGNGKAGAP
jgi:hypothetical protein